MELEARRLGAIAFFRKPFEASAPLDSVRRGLDAGGKEVFRYPSPGTWYLLPQVTKAPFDNMKVRRAVSQAIDRENVVKVAQGCDPRALYDPARVPRRRRQRESPRHPEIRPEGGHCAPEGYGL
jgi:ABC-type transport system substrate-binding protein